MESFTPPARKKKSPTLTPDALARDERDVLLFTQVFDSGLSTCRVLTNDPVSRIPPNTYPKLSELKPNEYCLAWPRLIFRLEI